MTIGLVPNTTKKDIEKIVSDLCLRLIENSIHFLISDSMIEMRESLKIPVGKEQFQSSEKLGKNCDVILSIGGDGTMLNTAYEMRKYQVPILGLNIGKLGFLAEYDLNDVNDLVKNLKQKNYTVEERISLEGKCDELGEEKLFALNDIVIEKGQWPKMINLTLMVDDKYVSTFSADGLIVSTPTGSTGYSLSAGGSVISPKAEVIGINPISAHTLTMRPLVLSSKQEITVIADSGHKSIQVNCDGQRVYNFTPPLKINIRRSNNKTRLLRADKNEYFNILRKKLFWGIDVRQNTNPD